MSAKRSTDEALAAWADEFAQEAVPAPEDDEDSDAAIADAQAIALGEPLDCSV